MVVMSLTFKIQNGVDDVFERFGAGNRSVFSDVTDQENRNGAVLREQEKLVRSFPHLRHRAGRGFDHRRKNSLDGIDYDGGRVETLNFMKNVFEIGLRQQEKILRLDSQSLAAEF